MATSQVEGTASIGGMASSGVDKVRLARLDRLFHSFLKSDRKISTVAHGQLFIEAVRSQQSPPQCLERILASTGGLQAVRRAVRVDTGAVYVCDHVLRLITYLSDPDAKAICGGQLLRTVLETIVDPPTAWNAMLQLYVDDKIQDATDSTAFAWLCLEIVSHSSLDLLESLTQALQKRPLLKSSLSALRQYGYQIKKILDQRASNGDSCNTAADSAGGRHDNDFANYRQISIYPTTDEFASTLRPFYRHASEISQLPVGEQIEAHLDNQFRLLREDMCYELREDLQIATSKKKSKRRLMILEGLIPIGIDTGDAKRGRSSSLTVGVTAGLETLAKKSAGARKTYLKDHPNFLRHNSFGAVCVNEEILGFAHLTRDVDEMAKNPPTIGLRFPKGDVMAKTLRACREGRNARFVVVDTPVFSYEPILKQLQTYTDLPLQGQLLGLRTATNSFVSSPAALLTINSVQKGAQDKSVQVRQNGRTVTLDSAQADALRYALESPLSIIQGPPGTGKSFIGAIAAAKVLKDPDTRLLILSYTNHALDQFVEDLLDIGIPGDYMVRLGSKSTLRTAHLSLDAKLKTSPARRTPSTWTRLWSLRDQAQSEREEIDDAFEDATRRISLRQVLEYLEFSDDSHDALCFDAFQIPEVKDGFQIAGRGGQALKADSLIELWSRGDGPGKLTPLVKKNSWQIWKMPPQERTRCLDRWTKVLLAEHIETLIGHVNSADRLQKEIDTLFNEAKCERISTQRIVACTTTGAAMYESLLAAVKPTCVLIEEVGEILEAHVLAALGPSVKQLILIGDHKQLRPKYKSYALSVEKGDGYDLNRSLFERLILQGHRHVTLRKQHRMDPEISQIVREMTYPELEDERKRTTDLSLGGSTARWSS